MDFFFFFWLSLFFFSFRLLRLGGDAMARNKEGRTPFLEAELYKHRAAADTLRAFIGEGQYVKRWWDVTCWFRSLWFSSGWWEVAIVFYDFVSLHANHFTFHLASWISDLWETSWAPHSGDYHLHCQSFLKICQETDLVQRSICHSQVWWEGRGERMMEETLPVWCKLQIFVGTRGNVAAGGLSLRKQNQGTDESSGDLFVHMIIQKQSLSHVISLCKKAFSTAEM